VRRTKPKQETKADVDSIRVTGPSGTDAGLAPDPPLRLAQVFLWSAAFPDRIQVSEFKRPAAGFASLNLDKD
jgi:hypothetical protein